MRHVPVPGAKRTVPGFLCRRGPRQDSLVVLAVSALLVLNCHARLLSCPCPGTNTSSAACDQQCQQLQRGALIGLYEAWGGNYWSENDDWLSNQPHCQWNGVSCCPNSTTSGSFLSLPKWSPDDAWQLVDPLNCCCGTPGAVSALQLPANNVTGQFAALENATALFSSLLLINLESNRLEGTLSSIGDFQQLHGVYLAQNSLAGSLPASVANLVNLRVLDVQSNLLNGSLPDALVQLPKLDSLYIQYNRLSGTLPLGLLLSAHLSWLEAGHNEIEGHLVVPAELSGPPAGANKAKKFENFELDTNKLTGPIPLELLQWVESLDLAHNALTGTLPILETEFLRTLRLRNNSLSGSIPPVLDSRNVWELDFAFNRFEGTLPAALSTLTDLSVLRLEGNAGLVGTLPRLLVCDHRLSLLDARQTGMQQPKFAVAGGGLTAVPDWMMIGQVTVSGDTFKVTATSSDIGSYAPDCSYPIPKCTAATLLVDPHYCQYEGCTCKKGDTADIRTSADGSLTQYRCIPATPPKPQSDLAIRVGTPIGFCAGLVLLVAVTAYVASQYRRSPALELLKANKRKRSKPPQEGQPLTLVLTDVAGSTALWEWDNLQASQAIDQHDKIMREYLSFFCGYEVTTEGDAFLLAFHEPGDAVAYCLTVQIALQEADWSAEVVDWCQQHLPSPNKPTHAAPRADSCSADLGAGLDLLQQSELGAAAISRQQLVEDFLTRMEAEQHPLQGFLPPASELFKCLRVRMAIATGIAEKVKQHKVTRMIEYFGQVVQKVQAMVETPEGGQVIMDGETYRDISMRLPQKGARVRAALEARGCKLPTYLGADTTKQSRRDGTADTLELAIGATAAMAAVTAAHYHDSQPVMPSRLRQSFSQQGGCALVHEGQVPSGNLQQYDPAGKAVPLVALKSGSHQFVGTTGRLDSYDTSFLLKMHDVVDNSEQWSTSNNAETGGALVSPGSPRQSKSEGCFESPYEARNLYGLPEAAAAVNRFGSALQQQSSFGQLLEASGASVTVGNRAPGLQTSRQSPLRSSSPWQTATLHAPGQANNSQHDYSRGSTGESYPSGCKQLASLESSVLEDALVPLQHQQISSSNPGQGSRETTQTHTTGLLHDIAQQQLTLGLEGEDPTNLSTPVQSNGTPEQSSRLSAQGSRETTQTHTSRLLHELAQHQLTVNSAGQCHGHRNATLQSRRETHTTGFLHTIRLHQLKFSSGGEDRGRSEQPQMQGQEPVCCEDVTLANSAPMMMLDDEENSVESDHELQLIMHDYIPCKQLAPISTSSAPLATVVGLHGVQSWQDENGLPKLSGKRRTSSAPPAALIAAAVRAAGDKAHYRETVSASGPPLLADARVDSRSAIFSRQWAKLATKSMPGQAGSRLQMIDSSLDGTSPERTGSHAWSDKVYAVIDRVTRPSATRRSTGAAPSYDSGNNAHGSGDPLSRHRNSPAQPLQPGQTAVMVLDMGIHKLPGIAEPLQLITVLPPGLEARAHFYPPLCTQQQQTPGYLDAPAAAQSPLVIEAYSRNIQHGYYDARAAGAMSVAQNIVILPPVLMVFCAVDGYHDMLAANRPAAEEMLQQYSDVIRWTLLVAGGYECQEQEGNYMIAFDDAAAALEWALLVQEVLLEVSWSKEVLALPGAAEVVVQGSGSTQFRGPRVRIGLYRGVPTRVVPHSTTGRADYFGSLVNRAARYCHTAAHAGQIVAPRDMVDELVHQWCGVHPAKMSGSGALPRNLVAHPLLDRSRPIWARCPQPRGAAHKSTRESATLDGRLRSSSGGGVPVTTDSMLMRSRVTLLDIPDVPVMSEPRVPSSARISSQGGSQVVSPVSPRFSGAAAIDARSAFGGFKLAHTSSMKRAVLIPSDMPSPHPVPDLSSLLALRKVAADQQQQHEQVRTGPENSAAPTATSGSASGVIRTEGGFDLDCGLAAAVYARLILHTWKWAETLLVHDVGEYTFKGINGSHSLVSITTKALEGRRFPARLRKSKGQQVSKGQGLLYKLQMIPLLPSNHQQSQSQQMLHDGQPTRFFPGKRIGRQHRNSTGSMAGILHTDSRFAQLQGIDMGLQRCMSDSRSNAGESARSGRGREVSAPGGLGSTGDGSTSDGGISIRGHDI